MYNRSELIGNVGQDPEIRHLEGGNCVANFSLATSETYKNKAGEKVTDTEWHKIVVWGKLAELVEQYVKKGDKLFLAGKIKTRSWESEGEKKYITEIVCTEMKMLSSKQSGSVQESRTEKPVSEPAPNNAESDSSPVDGLDQLPF